MTTAPQIIATLCRGFGPQVKPPPGSVLHGDRVLWGLAGAESDFGARALARHEDGYCYGHRYDDPRLSAKFGCLAHCSYGPWQMMFPHIITYLGPEARLLFLGSTPQSADSLFEAFAARCARAAVAMLNADIFGRQQAMTFPEVAKAWNHGTWNDAYDDDAYVQRAVAALATPWPEGVAA